MAKKRKKAKSWTKRAPSTVAERRKLAKKCKSQCFADPKRLKYPMCSKRSNVCGLDCQGALAAFRRARQQHNNAVAKRALKAGKKAGCSWVKTGAVASRLAKRWKV